MIGIVDYGLGNLFSLANALKYIGAEFSYVKTPDEIEGKSSLILPGVGAFPEGMKRLAESGMTQALTAYKKPLLGICLGMQLLFDSSEEFSFTKGLGLIPGKVVRLSGDNIKIPHIGWNLLEDVKESPIIKGLGDKAFVYFVHSYKALTEDKYLVAASDYHQKITAIASNGNVYGTQFHPEKSGDAGIIILKNFINLGENQ